MENKPTINTIKFNKTSKTPEYNFSNENFLSNNLSLFNDIASKLNELNTKKITELKIKLDDNNEADLLNTTKGLVFTKNDKTNNISCEEKSIKNLLNLIYACDIKCSIDINKDNIQISEGSDKKELIKIFFEEKLKDNILKHCQKLYDKKFEIQKEIALKKTTDENEKENIKEIYNLKNEIKKKSHEILTAGAPYKELDIVAIIESSEKLKNNISALAEINSLSPIKTSNLKDFIDILMSYDNDFSVKPVSSGPYPFVEHKFSTNGVEFPFYSNCPLYRIPAIIKSESMIEEKDGELHKRMPEAKDFVNYYKNKKYSIVQILKKDDIKKAENPDTNIDCEMIINGISFNTTVKKSDFDNFRIKSIVTKDRASREKPDRFINISESKELLGQDINLKSFNDQNNQKPNESDNELNKLLEGILEKVKNKNTNNLQDINNYLKNQEQECDLTYYLEEERKRIPLKAKGLSITENNNNNIDVIKSESAYLDKDSYKKIISFPDEKESKIEGKLYFNLDDIKNPYIKKTIGKKETNITHSKPHTDIRSWHVAIQSDWAIEIKNLDANLINKHQDDETGTSITQIFPPQTSYNEDYYESYLLINKGNTSFAVKTLVKKEDLESFQDSQNNTPLPRKKIVPIASLLTKNNKGEYEKYDEKDDRFITEFNNINNNITNSYLANKYTETATGGYLGPNILRNEKLIERFSGIEGLKIDVKDLNFTDQDFTIYDSKYPKIPLKISNPKIEGDNNVISGINDKGKLSENNLITLDLNLYGKKKITNNSNYAINFIYDKDNNLKPVFKLKKEKNKEQNNDLLQEILKNQTNLENKDEHKDKEVSNEDEYDLFKFEDPEKEKAFLEKLNDKKYLTIKGSELTRLEPNDAIKPAPSDEKGNSPNPIISPTGLHPIGGSRSILNSNVTRDAVRGGITAGLLFCPFGPLLALAFLFFTRNKDKAEVSQEDLSVFIDSLGKDNASLKNTVEELSNKLQKEFNKKDLTEKEKRELNKKYKDLERETIETVNDKKKQNEQSEMIKSLQNQIELLNNQLSKQNPKDPTKLQTNLNNQNTVIER